MKSKPCGYWRLTEVAGSTAADSSGNHLNGEYDGNVAYYLPGPPGKGLSSDGSSSRAAHFASGRLHANVPSVGDKYSAEFWFWNGLPNDARAVTAYLLSRAADDKNEASGESLGIGGSAGTTGKLFFLSGDKLPSQSVALTTIEPRTWNHVAVVREGTQVRVYLNGKVEPEIAGDMSAGSSAASTDWHFAGRPDDSFSLEGKMSEAALYDRALTAKEVKRHYDAAAVSPTSH
jgi:hypothetical protein